MQNLPGQSGHTRPSVLAVDDTPANLVAMNALLRSLEVEVVLASSGFEAIEQVEKREFAVILLDVMMPELDGFGTLARIRQLDQGKDVPVLLVTAYDLEKSAMQRAYALSAIDYIRKPIEPEILQGKLAALLTLHRREQEVRAQAQALRAKDRHISVLAHDLRGPIQVVVAAADALSRHADPDVRKKADRVTRAATRMSKLTHDVLEYARMAAGRVELHVRPIDLSVLCGEVLDDFEATYPQVTFVKDVCTGVTGSWDPERLQQVLGNLLANAVKYGAGRVQVKLEKDARLVRLSVENGGAGIPAELLEHIFDPFVQASTRSTGVGLGLYIVKEIAVAHGGRAMARSSGGITSFTIELPAS
jgi:two-component system sensor histidine kinase/response regulator